MKLKKTTFLLFLFQFYLLSSSTIIDSVYSDPAMDGKITFSQEYQNFGINCWMYNLYAGDIGDHGMEPASDNNSYVRSFIAFYLPEIPLNYVLDSAYIRMYQYSSRGNTGWWETDPQDFAVWDVPGGDTIKCVLSHIDYGNSLDVSDWEKGDVGNPYTFNHNIGVITESGEDGYRYLDVTTSVYLDYYLDRTISQYRIAFDGIDTDWDNLYDNVGFISGNSQAEWMRPQLFMKFSELLSTSDDKINQPTNSIVSYPNPLFLGKHRNSVSISFELYEPSQTTLQVFNIKCQLIDTIYDGFKENGKHSLTWNAEDLSPGVYFYLLKTKNQAITKKTLILK